MGNALCRSDPDVFEERGWKVAKENAIDKRGATLRLYLTICRHLLKTDDLHFGYWANGLEVDLHNVPAAQEAHSQFIISHIPSGAKTILDVGCGVGKMASRLIELGYCVDGVSPSPFLTNHARQLVGEEFHIFECGFEDLDTENRYDLLMFSESFQYVKTEPALQNCLKLLNEDGHLLVCDFFRTEADGEGPLNAGPRLSHFYDVISGMAFKPVKDIDITKETAPTMDLVDGLLKNVGRPIWELALSTIERKRPLIFRFLKWKLKEKIAQMERKHLSGAWDGAHFKRLKSYRLMLYRKDASITPG